MLRDRSLRRAALALALALLWPFPAAADHTIGGSCPGGADGAQSADGNNVVCIGGVWQYPAYQYPSTAASCNGTNAGMMQWTGSAFEGCNGTSWVKFPGLVLLSTKTASGGTSIQFTGLSTYITYFMNCSGLTASSGGSGDIYFWVGEGATPTWKTTSQYCAVNNNTGAGHASPGVVVNSCGAADIIGYGGQSTSIPMSLKAYLFSEGGFQYSAISFQLFKYIDGVGAYMTSGGGSWGETTGDTNAITALELAVTSGTMSGKCSLYQFTQ